MQKIIVSNFRQISYAEIEIKQFLVLIGQQASGKSTLAKLIYFFRSLKEDYLKLIDENVTTKHISGKLLIQKIQDKFNVYFGYTTELAPDFEITFFYVYSETDESINRSLTLSKKNSLQVSFGGGYYREVYASLQEHSKLFLNFYINQTSNDTSNLIAESNKLRIINKILEGVNTLFNDDYIPLFFPAGRNITVSYPDQFQALFLENLFSANTPANTSRSIDLILMRNFILHSKFLNDYFRGNGFETLKKTNVSSVAFDFFKRHAAYILQGKYENSDGNEKIVFNSNKSVPLNIASSGQQESIRIVQDLFYILAENQKTFRIIEEPEAHLYPEAQKKLIELMALIVNKTNSQVIITTHSPYIISILNNLLLYSIVAQNKPNSVPKIEEHFGTQQFKSEKNEKISLNASQIQAYSLNTQGEYCTSIIDRETGMIGTNYLDGITEELNNDFEVLYHLNFQK